MAKDPPPPHGDLTVTRDEEICGKRIADERLLIGPGGAVRNAVVSIEGIEAGRAADLTVRPRLENTGCRFEPHVLSVTVGQKLEIVNKDPLLHTTHALMDGHTTVFDVTLPIQNHKIPRLISRPGVMSLQCDAGHTWMLAWILAFPHPYHAVTAEDGSFAIEGIPPGRYRVRAWHEELGTQVLEVSIEAKEEARLTFDGLDH